MNKSNMRPDDIFSVICIPPGSKVAVGQYLRSESSFLENLDCVRYWAGFANGKDFFGVHFSGKEKEYEVAPLYEKRLVGDGFARRPLKNSRPYEPTFCRKIDFPKDEEMDIVKIKAAKTALDKIFKN